MDQGSVLAIARPIVERQIRRFPKLGQDVDDVVQDVVEKFLRAWPAQHQPRNLEAWLETTTRHTLVDRARWEGRHREVPIEEDVVEAMMASRESPSLHVLRNRLIHRILSCIPEQDADLLRLRYLQGASADELAARLGIAVNAVDQRTSRAKRLLREKLAEQPELVEELYAAHPRLY